MSEELSLDSLQRLIIKFAVKDANSGKSLRIHQAFVKFTNAEENENVLFVATPDGANNYRLYVVCICCILLLIFVSYSNCIFFFHFTARTRYVTNELSEE